MDEIGWLSDVVVRTATELDLPSLEWDGEYIHFRNLFSQVFASSREGKAVIWLADHRWNGVIGQVFVQLNSGRRELADGTQRGYIYGFRVKPAFRRAGLGSLMLANVERDLFNRGFAWATLNVSQDNPEAINFYQRFGYSIFDEEPGDWTYLDHQGILREVHEPAFRLMKKLVD